MSSTPKRQVITITAGAGVIKVTNLATLEISATVFAATNTLIEERISSVSSIFIAEIKIIDFVIKDRLVYVPLAIIDIPATNDYFRLQATEGPDLNAIYVKTIENTLGTLLMAEEKSTDTMTLSAITPMEELQPEESPAEAELLIKKPLELLLPTDSDFENIMRKARLNKPH